MSAAACLTKRTFDIVGSVLGLVVFSPVFLLIYCLIKHEDGGPAIFKQERIGYGGRPYPMAGHENHLSDSSLYLNRKEILNMERKTIHIKDGLQLRKIKDQHMIVEACNGNMNMSNVYSLNHTAARLWEQLERDSYTVQELAEWFCNVYDIDFATALNDVKKQLAEWEAYELINCNNPCEADIKEI